MAPEIDPGQAAAPDAPDAPDADAEAIAGLLQAAIAVAVEEPAVAAAMGAVRVLTLSVGDDGAITVDVDGVSTVVAPDEITPAEPGDSMPPPPPA